MGPRVRGDEISMPFQPEYNIPFQSECKMSLGSPEPEQIGINDLLNIIEDNNSEFIKMVTFMLPSHLSILHEKHPEFLNNIKIIVDFDRFNSSRKHIMKSVDFKKISCITL